MIDVSLTFSVISVCLYPSSSQSLTQLNEQSQQISNFINGFSTKDSS